MPSRREQPLLEYSYDPAIKYEICLDEVGRGPLFGRLYTGAVVIKRDGTFDRKNIKDSKKFSSKIKMKEVAKYIEENAICYNLHYVEPSIIDEINILQAVYKSMHENIRSILDKLILLDPEFSYDDVLIVVDGDRFKPFVVYNNLKESMQEIPHVTVEQGDAKYVGIASASIIAKVAHDEYIHHMCLQYPLLDERYGLDKNVGYGTAAHINGIKTFGITQWHRKSYGICKNAVYSPL